MLRPILALLCLSIVTTEAVRPSGAQPKAHRRIASGSATHSSRGRGRESSRGLESARESGTPLRLNSLFHKMGLQHGTADLLRAKAEMSERRVMQLTHATSDSSFLSGPSMFDSVADLPSFGLYSATGSYFITAGLGTPPQELTFVVDTGSSGLWANCDLSPSTGGESGSAPAFRPTQSSSYLPQACSDPACAVFNEFSGNLTVPSCISGLMCPFRSTYGDQSHFSGFLTTDTLTLSPLGGNTLVQGTAGFGCSVYEVGFDSQIQQVGIVGIMGFGATGDSVPQQLSSQGVVAPVFSICMDSTNYNGSYVILGNSPVPPNLNTVPMDLTPRSAPYPASSASRVFYFVDVMKISVGNAAIIGSESLGYNSSSVTGGVFLDSGTTFTQMPSNIFIGILQAVGSASGHMFTYNNDSGLYCISSTGPLDLKGFPDIILDFGPNVNPWRVPATTWTVSSELQSGEYITCIGAMGTSMSFPSMIVGETWMADKFIVFDNAANVIQWTEFNCSTLDFNSFPPASPLPPMSPSIINPSPPIIPVSPNTPPTPVSPNTPPIPVGPDNFPPSPVGPNPPPSPGGSGVSISCNPGASWQAGGQNFSQYNCQVANSNPYPITTIQLSCTGFNPTAEWNINADCTIPSLPAVYAGQSWSFGYQSVSGPATISLESFKYPQPDITVLPPTNASSQLSLICSEIGPSYISNGDFVYQYGCTVHNGGTSFVSQVKLKCNNFQPSTYWNINLDCSLSAFSIGPGQDWSFGFQTTVASNSFGIDSYSLSSYRRR